MPISPDELSARLETAARQLRQIRAVTVEMVRIGNMVFGGREVLKGGGSVFGRRRDPVDDDSDR
ncbi:MAG TPA: hypothetical protein VK979_05390 [Guyparkeria sp.]|nr:hypothetical protein [Guyparkeria sp.]